MFLQLESLYSGVYREFHAVDECVYVLLTIFPFPDGKPQIPRVHVFVVKWMSVEVSYFVDVSCGELCDIDLLKFPRASGEGGVGVEYVCKISGFECLFEG